MPSMTDTTEATHTGNRLLAALPGEELDRIEPALETIALEFKQDLYLPNQAIDHVWFPHVGVISLVNEAPESRPVEFATVGNEGMAGIQVLLGDQRMPSRCLCQIPGSAARMEIRAFRRAQAECPAFRALLLRYTLALLNLIAQSASCNRSHAIEERCARWLLLTHDRVNGARQFPLTQEFLAQMLGVRRASVSVAQAMLQKAGLIRYTRGNILIVDRAGLEAASCTCYSVIRAEFDRLLPSSRSAC